MKKGDIFIATDKSKHPHPIVFLERISEEKFLACIISTKNTHGNIEMSERHFFRKDENGKDYDIVFNNSHLVPYRVFEKEEFWLKSKKPKGKLTENGIRFVEEYTEGVDKEYHPIPIWKNR